MDLAISAIPLWITAASPAPYLICDGSAFSAVTYPALAAYLGGTTLPDGRGRVRYALNGGTGRMTAINANTILSGGGSQTLIAANLPPITVGSSTLTVGSSTLTASSTGLTATTTITDPTHRHTMFTVDGVTPGSDFGLIGGTGVLNANTSFGTTGITATSTVGGTISISGTPTISGSLTSSGVSTVYAGPGYVGGITLIRAG